MNGPKTRWAGADLGPLAFESPLSYLLRFAWRNAINDKILCRRFSKTKTKLAFNAIQFAEETGWCTGIESNANWTLVPAGAQRLWVTERLRYCPLCLEQSYHCFLFQCTSISCCPYHGIELSDRCHCCGVNTAKCAMGAMLFRHPYLCHWCEKPISGAYPNLDGHLQFRSEQEQWQQAFAPYVEWWSAVVISHQRITALLSDRQVQYQRKWCHTDYFLRAAVGKELPRLEYLRHAVYSEDDVVSLKWKYKIAVDARHDLGPIRLNRTLRIRMPQAVYRCTLRLLGRAIAPLERLTHTEVDDVLFRCRGQNVSDYPASVLALICMRWQLEMRFSGFPGFTFWPIGHAQLDDVPSVSMKDYAGRTPRLGWRAIFLAIYASWRERILAAQHCTLAELRNESRIDSAYIFARNNVCCRRRGQWWYCQTHEPEEAWFEGEVVFLKLDGLPIAPFSQSSGTHRVRDRSGMHR